MQRLSKYRVPSGGFLNRMVMGLILVLIVVSLPAIYSLSRGRIQAFHEAQQSSRSTAQILGQSVTNTLEKVDYALQVTVEEVLCHQQRGGDTQELLQFIERQYRRLPELDSLMITDARGMVLLGSGHQLPGPVSLADREYFTYLRDHTGAGLVLSKPIISKISGKRGISCARRITLPDGSFGGVAFGVLPLQQFQELFSKATLGKNGSVALRFADMELIIRHTAQENAEVSPGRAEKKISAAWQQKLEQGETTEGSYLTESVSDGVRRSFSYIRLSPYPLYLNVGLAVDDYLKFWRKDLLLTLLALAGCWAGVLLLIRQMYQYKRQTELEKQVQERTSALLETSQELAWNEERLQALLDISKCPATTIQELLDYTLEKVIRITGSTIGYIYLYHEDLQQFVLNTWSKGVMPSCSVANPQTVYQLEKTGIWGEVVRQRKPILVNDFAEENPLKRGYPEGHVPLSRFLSVPVMDEHQQIVAVVGVANKELPYTDQDVLQLDLMMSEVWRIAKRLELELKLIHAGQEWQTTFDAISDSVSLIDLEQRVLRCNLASTRLFKRNFEAIIGTHCWELVHGTDHPIEDCPMLRACRSRKTESQLVFEGQRWLQITVDPLLDEQGVVTGAVHIVHDDTERVASEQSMRDLLAMLEAVQNELYVFRPDTLQFEYVNRTAQRNLGYSEAQLLQMTPLDLKPFNRREFVQLLAPLLSGDQNLLRFESVHTRADASSYPIEVHLQLVATLHGQRYLAVVHDISERRHAKQQLDVANEWLANASEAAHIALWSWDIGSGSLIWSNSIDRMLGTAPGSFPRTIEAWEQIIHPEDRERVNQALNSHIEAHTPYEIDYRVRCTDGSYLDWHDSGRAYYDDSGVAIRMSGACIDVTDRTKDELRIRELQAQLLQNDKMASIGQLSAGIAHEINNPMGFINSNLGTLEKYVDKFDRYIATLEAVVEQSASPQQQQAVTELRKTLKLEYVLKDIRQLLAESEEGADRVMKIVKDLKTFARSDTEQLGNADLNQCIDSTLTIIWNQIKYVADLTKEYGELPKVTCNVQQINQVLLNLLVNAAHAVEDKGGEELGTVTIRTWADDKNAFVAISDTGCGIPEEIRSRVFDPFFTTKEVGKGTGLGLSISHEIIKKHGGELTMASELGKGSTFTISLPLSPPESDSTSC